MRQYALQELCDDKYRYELPVLQAPLKSTACQKGAPTPNALGPSAYSIS